MDENAVICRGCDFILDTEFLGDGILDEEHSLRPGAGGVDASSFNLADAVILGNIDDDSQSFETSDSGFHMTQNLSARLYVSGRSQALMSPDAVPAMSAAVDGLRLTPFERHVLAFIDGRRPVEMIRKAAGLDEAEVKTALATLADKGVVKVVGRALSDVDFDAETAPKSPFRRARVRGSIVGAVALVGDEADQAIDEAFRTQVLVSPLRPAVEEANRPAAEVHIDDEDAGPTGHEPRRPPTVPSDADEIPDLQATGEVEAARHVVPLAPVRRAPPPRVDSALDASFDSSLEEPLAPALTPPIQSDGFDDFSDPSDLSANLARAGSLSSGPRRQPARLAGAFPEISASGAGLAGLDELADSRVQLRPDDGGEPVPATLARPAHDPDASLLRERDAASGEVWGSPALRPLGIAPPRDPKRDRTNAGSLSALLSESDSDATANVAPEEVAALLALQVGAHEGFGSEEEATVGGQPMPPQLLPRVGRVPHNPDNTGRVRVPLGKSAMASLPEEQALEPLDEHSGLHAPPAPPALPMRGRGAAEDIFDGDDDADAAGDAEAELLGAGFAGASDTGARGPMTGAHAVDAQPSVADSSIDASEELDPQPIPARPPRAAQARAQLVDEDSAASQSAASNGGARPPAQPDGEPSDPIGTAVDADDSAADRAANSAESDAGRLSPGRAAAAVQPRAQPGERRNGGDETSLLSRSRLVRDGGEDASEALFANDDSDVSELIPQPDGEPSAADEDGAGAFATRGEASPARPAPPPARAAAKAAPLLSTHASSLPSGEATEWPSRLGGSASIADSPDDDDDPADADDPREAQDDELSEVLARSAQRDDDDSGAGEHSDERGDADSELGAPEHDDDEGADGGGDRSLAPARVPPRNDKRGPQRGPEPRGPPRAPPRPRDASSDLASAASSDASGASSVASSGGSSDATGISEPAARAPLRDARARAAAKPARPQTEASEGSGSSEIVESAMLIRPAARAVPLAVAVAAARGSRPAARHRPVEVSSSSGSSDAGSERSEAAEEHSDEQESSEETVNVDREDIHARGALNRGGAHVAVGKDARGAAALPSGYSDAVGRSDASQRPKPTDEMKRKGRQLFDEAMKERAAGRMGAARMNAKLASIYDPDTPRYAAALREWDEGGGAGAVGAPPAPPPPTRPAPPAARPATEPSAPQNSEENERELRALYDEAQDFENSGDFDAALDVLSRGAHRFPGAAAFHNRIGVLLAMKKRDFDGAIASIQRAIDLEPDNLHYRNNLGKVMQRVRSRS